MQSMLTVKFYFFLPINIFIIFIIIIIKYYHLKLTLVPRQVLLDSMKELRNRVITWISNNYVRLFPFPIKEVI